MQRSGHTETLFYDEWEREITTGQIIRDTLAGASPNGVRCKRAAASSSAEEEERHEPIRGRSKEIL